MPTYGVTGASGHLGRRVIENLLSRGVPAGEIVAVVRTPEKAADLAGRGVDVRLGDYSRPETLPAALAGVRRLLLVSGSEPGKRVPQHAAVVEAATAAGVERLLYTSILRADTSTNPLAGEHKASEEIIAAAGLPYTLLRNSWYTENYTQQLQQYLDTGQIVGAAGAGKVSAAPRADYAEAATAALVGDEGGDVTYELGGTAFTFEELAAAVTEVTGTKVGYRDLPPAEYAAVLREAGLDAATAEFVAAIDSSIAAGDLETGSDDLTRLIGRPTGSLTEAVAAAVG
ncbi:MAG: NAD(P)H-binding protein [Mycobacteriales bacterium]